MMMLMNELYKEKKNHNTRKKKFKNEGKKTCIRYIAYKH